MESTELRDALSSSRFAMEEDRTCIQGAVPQIESDRGQVEQIIDSRTRDRGTQQKDARRAVGYPTDEQDRLSAAKQDGC